ncbi:MAG: hypothetical protein RR357_05310 [Clostridia bacterium]
MQNTLLKQRAIEAKRRLQNGCSGTNCYGNFPIDKFNIRLPFLINDETIIKICNLIKSNDGTLNPLMQLIDRNYLETLSIVEQQRYVFRLSELYLYIKNAYVNINY